MKEGIYLRNKDEVFIDCGLKPTDKKRNILLPILLFPVFPSLYKFSDSIKKEVRENQNNICADTGIKCRKLEIHHKLPQCMGGSDKLENAVGLAGEKEKIDAHEKWDRITIDTGIMFGGETIDKATPNMIKDFKKWIKFCTRFKNNK